MLLGSWDTAEVQTWSLGSSQDPAAEVYPWILTSSQALVWLSLPVLAGLGAHRVSTCQPCRQNLLQGGFLESKPFFGNTFGSCCNSPVHGNGLGAEGVGAEIPEPTGEQQLGVMERNKHILGAPKEAGQDLLEPLPAWNGLWGPGWMGIMGGVPARGRRWISLTPKVPPSPFHDPTIPFAVSLWEQRWLCHPALSVPLFLLPLGPARGIRDEGSSGVGELLGRCQLMEFSRKIIGSAPRNCLGWEGLLSPETPVPAEVPEFPGSPAAPLHCRAGSLSLIVPGCANEGIKAWKGERCRPNSLPCSKDSCFVTLSFHPFIPAWSIPRWDPGI